MAQTRPANEGSKAVPRKATRDNASAPVVPAAVPRAPVDRGDIASTPLPSAQTAFERFLEKIATKLGFIWLVHVMEWSERVALWMVLALPSPLVIWMAVAFVRRGVRRAYAWPVRGQPLVSRAGTGPGYIPSAPPQQVPVQRTYRPENVGNDASARPWEHKYEAQPSVAKPQSQIRPTPVPVQAQAQPQPQPQPQPQAPVAPQVSQQPQVAASPEVQVPSPAQVQVQAEAPVAPIVDPVPAMAPAVAFAPEPEPEPVQPEMAPPITAVAAVSVASAADIAALPPRVEEPVQWFDEQSFLALARNNFKRLQAAWDKADLDTLRSLMTHDMLAQVEQQMSDRAQLAEEEEDDTTTEVVALDAKLLQLEESPDAQMASVEFSGMILEDPTSTPTPFREIWNITHRKNSVQGWLVAGVQVLHAV